MINKFLHTSYWLVGLLLLVFILNSCKTSQINKTLSEAEKMKALDSLYTQKNYRVDIEVVYPFTSLATTQVSNVLLRNTGNTANRIDVSGDGNFIEIKNDSIKGYLPFFGERRLNAGEYGGRDLAIQFEQALSDLKKNINKDKAKLELEFSAKQKGMDNEQYDISIEIFPDHSVRVDVTPVYRTFIRYDGILVENDKEVE